LGGSLIVPDEINVPFLKEFRDLIVAQIEQKQQRFLFITGGGRTARCYAKAAGEVCDHVSNEDKDWLGIHATRMNAHLIRTVFCDYAHPRINTNPHDLEDFHQTTKPVMVAAGWKPGFSTDYDTALLTRYLGIKKVINLSNIDYIYDKDPNKFPDAQKIEELSWKEYRAMNATEWIPGLNVPFDPVASEFAEKEDIEVVTMKGTNLENLAAYLNDEKFEGTVIRNN
ncbi:MAG: UMP kinase, partial [Candidatus Moraniibacteriota bacterium]